MPAPDDEQQGGSRLLPLDGRSSLARLDSGVARFLLGGRRSGASNCPPVARDVARARLSAPSVRRSAAPRDGGQPGRAWVLPLGRSGVEMSPQSQPLASFWRIRRRLGLCLVLAGAGVVTGGGAAVLVAIVILMLVADAVIPMPGRTWSEADDRFRRLVAERRRVRRLRRLRGLAPERLDVLDDREGWALTVERRALGVQPIQIDSVTGTVEESKAETFDRAFRPDRSTSARWKAIWIAHARGIGLPPVAVYRVGAQHIVRDGHHRISVARDHGVSTIDAEIVDLQRARPAQQPRAA